MKLTRILCLLLALVLSLACLVSCKGNEEEPTTTETPEENSVVDLDLAKDGATEYVLVYDYKADPTVKQQVEEFKTSFAAWLGVEISSKMCYSDIEEKGDVPTEKEILVGVTNREESIEALSTLRTGDFVIGAYGSKLVIGGITAEATCKALIQFNFSILQDQGNMFSVLNGETFDCTFSSTKNSITEATYSYSKCFIMDARIDSFALIYAEGNAATAADYKSFAEELQTHISQQTGYELPVLKDSRYWADYQILIGETEYTDRDLAKDIGDDDYYISLEACEVTYEDNSKHPGAVIQILYGVNAREAAFAAFKASLIKISSTPLDVNINSPMVETNMVIE